MATIEELQAQLAALTARVDVITTPPETYYTMQYQGETIDQLLSMAPDNLLDNVNFQNPVNQRGVSGTISTPGFFIDRWYLVSGSAQITSAGLVLNGTMRQTREFAVGAPTTASALTTTGVVAASYDDSTKVFTLTGTGQTFITAKLELNNVSTVGYQNSGGVWVPSQIPIFQTELSKCQRFLYNSMYEETGESGNYKIEVWTITSGTTHFSGGVRFPQKMSAVPTVTFYSGVNRTEGAVAYGSNGLDAVSTPYANFIGTGGFAQINLIGDDPTLTGNQISFFIIANAEL